MRRSWGSPLVLAYMLLTVFLAMLYGCGPQKKHLRGGKNPAGIGQMIENITLPDGPVGTVKGSLFSENSTDAMLYTVHIEGFRGASAVSVLSSPMLRRILLARLISPPHAFPPALKA